MKGLWNMNWESFKLLEFANEIGFLNLFAFNAVQQSDKLVRQALDVALSLRTSLIHMNSVD